MALRFSSGYILYWPGLTDPTISKFQKTSMDSQAQIIKKSWNLSNPILTQVSFIRS